MSSLLQVLKSDWEIAQHGVLSRVPLYHRLYSVLKAAIMDGKIAHGAQMPTELQLAATFEVSRITAKRAMDELAAENLVARYRGKGSHVTYQYEHLPVRVPLVGMLENLIEMSKHSKVRVESIDKLVPPGDIAALMGLKEGQKVHQVVRVSSNEDGEPYARYVSYTLGITRGYTKCKLERTPRIDILRENGIQLTRMEQELAAENASVRIAKDLDTKPGAALLSIRRKSVNDAGDVIDVIDGLYNPMRFRFSMVLGVD